MKKTLTGKGIPEGTWLGKPPGKRLFTIKEAALYLGRPVSGVRTLIWKGRLPYIQDGRKQYFDIADLDGYINCNKTTMI
jgi:excisionase family DNA binding protein